MGQYYNVLIERNGKSKAYDRSVDGEYTMAKLTEHSWWFNEFVSTVTKMLYKKPSKVAWVGDYSDNEPLAIAENLYKRAWKGKQYGVTKDEMYLDNKYLVNHSKKVYLDCENYKNKCSYNGWCMHPLPLLTAIGNGLGGGDYSGINEEDIGRWCWDVISVEDDKPKEYTEDTFEFVESWQKNG